MNTKYFRMKIAKLKTGDNSTSIKGRINSFNVNAGQNYPNGLSGTEIFAEAPAIFQNPVPIFQN
jgi:hypothetical protein